MKAINRSFYHTIEAESYPDRPSCLVCGFVFANGTSEDSHYSYVDPRYRTGSSICRAEALEDWKASGKENWWKRTWWNTSRAILYHPATGTCRLSGVSLHPLTTGLVPTNEKDGYVCGSWFGWLSPKERQLFVSPDIICPTQEPAPDIEWVAYFVHSRCWELLTHHDLGAIAERNLGIVLDALRDRHKTLRHIYLEKGLRLNLGDGFWRTRLSTRIFYEVKKIATDEVNWKRLSMLLERRLKKSNALAIRRFIISSLDRPLLLFPRGSPQSAKVLNVTEEQIPQGDNGIKSVMVESNIREGNKKQLLTSRIVKMASVSPMVATTGPPRSILALLLR
ncbi:hypothetical protein ASPNIDRAFT_36017 [Aspergillus niger ATCC 1015]|uniref:Uncharacterized protein n=1 Tax=Aspergillus niger (strain ATCC 1015 / CBS 113.46 / FGSC A1144 / LSHB Ac4 / NCTC 3858a / NRRL 328 / USDA 3528.7) TaxID=380704 RepID=G3XST3_ASPNA|nr:hypothetical protein ASPNIDRAFT_36017 [Aspergillus niger ATCC 1015]